MPRRTYSAERPRPHQPPTPKLHLLAAQMLAALDRGESVRIIDRETGASTTWHPDGTTIDVQTRKRPALAGEPLLATPPIAAGEGLERHHRTH